MAKTCNSPPPPTSLFIYETLKLTFVIRESFRYVFLTLHIQYDILLYHTWRSVSK